MLIIKLWRFLLGYVKFSASGEFCERILNLCAYNSITLWDIERRDGMIFASMPISSYKKIRKIRAKSKIRIKIIKKCGLYYTLKPYNMRFGFAVGVAVFFAIIFIMPQFIWNIRVSGNGTVSEKEILSACRDIGIYEGAPIKNIDPSDARLKIMMKLDSLAWAAVNIEGSRVTVDVSEAEKTEKNDWYPSNLKASSDGVVKDVKIKTGQTIVKVGDTVQKGDLLVSGVVEYATGCTVFKKAEGSVVAETAFSEECVISKEKKSLKETGETLKRSVLDVFGIKIPLYLGSVKGDYNKKITESKMEFKNGYMPIKITTAQFDFLEETTEFLNGERVMEEAEKVFLKRLEKRGGEIKVIKCSDFIEETETEVKIKREYLCEQDIAISEPINLINDK